VELATGGIRDALYDLPIEDMVVQMNLAAQIALDAPHPYEALLRVLARGVPPADLNVVLKVQADATSPSEYFDARTRVARRIQRSLDGVRIAGGNFRWQLLCSDYARHPSRDPKTQEMKADHESGRFREVERWPRLLGQFPGFFSEVPAVVILCEVSSQCA
jgi:hypothetical protein